MTRGHLEAGAGAVPCRPGGQGQDTLTDAEARYLRTKTRLRAVGPEGAAFTDEFLAARDELRRYLEALWPGPDEA